MIFFFINFLYFKPTLSGQVVDNCYGANIIYASEYTEFKNRITANACTALTSSLIIGNAEVSSDISVISLSPLTSIDGDLSVVNVPINDLTGFNSLTTISGTVTLSALNMTALNGFTAVTSIGGGLSFGLSPMTTTVATSFFLNLVSVGKQLTARTLIGLTIFDGFPNLLSIGGVLNLAEMPALITLNAFSALQTITGKLALTDLNVGSFNFISLKACGGLEIDKVTNLANLDQFTNLKSIFGTFSISGLPLIINLNGFNHVETVGIDLVISSMVGLSTISLPALTSVGGTLRILNNDGVTTVSGLGALRTIGQNLVVDQNAKLTSLDGLSSLVDVGGDVTITSNAALVSLNRFTALLHAKSLIISGNDALSSIDGFAALSSLGGDLKITSNARLTSIAGLNALVSIEGVLNIQNNPFLPKLVGLTSIRSVVGTGASDSNVIVITGNPQFCDTFLITWNNLIAAPNIATISQNSADCPESLAEQLSSQYNSKYDNTTLFGAIVGFGAAILLLLIILTCILLTVRGGGRGGGGSSSGSGDNRKSSQNDDYFVKKMQQERDVMYMSDFNA